MYSLYGELEQLVMRGEKHRRVLSRKIICLASTAPPPLSLSLSLSPLRGNGWLSRVAYMTFTRDEDAHR